MKLLYILNIANRLNAFSHSSMLAAQRLGITFHIAGNWGYKTEQEREADAEKWGIVIHQVDFCRNPVHLGNWKAFRQLDALVKKHQFDIIHCNTPIGGLIGRLVGRKWHIRPMIYQVHGFHFYQGAPLMNWMLYYPAEKLLARWTDVMICINREDEALARQRMRLRDGGQIHYLPGIGIDTGRLYIHKRDRVDVRKDLNVSPDSFVVLSVGELNRNKNHEVVLEAIADLPKVHYMIAGKGESGDKLLERASVLGVEDRFHLLGFRTDIADLYHAADVFCLPSYREGLSLALMEAMAVGLPVIASDIRGNRDLIVQDEGGFLVSAKSISGFADAVRLLREDANGRDMMGAFNREYIKQFDIAVVVDQMERVYNSCISDCAKAKRSNDDSI